MSTSRKSKPAASKFSSSRLASTKKRKSSNLKMAKLGRSVAECFGENLKQLRKDRDWSQAELAKRCELSKGFLQNLEAGRRWVGPATISVIANELQVSQSDLFKDCRADKLPDVKTLFKRLGEALGLEIPDALWAKVKSPMPGPLVARRRK